MLSTTTRVLLAAAGALLAFGGLAATSVGAGISGLWATAMGAAIIVAVVIERQRYRSETADGSFEPIGPGSGEPTGPIEPRFRPTDEVFADPTTNHQMRVHVDPTTGERRYVAEA